MSSSPKYSYLLFLLLLAFLFVLLLLKQFRGYVPRASNLVARVPNGFLFLRAWAPRPVQAPATSHEELPPTTMSDTVISPRDENDRWKALISESEAAIGQCLAPKINMDLAPFIRCITFRVFLVVFLGVDAATLAPPDVLRVTGALTNFYNDEEAKSTIPPEVQRILYEWLPSEHFPFSLDRILPAYEALWRIIATLVVTCKDDETNDLRWVMLDFRDNPRDRQYTASFRTDRKSVSDITEGVARITPIARSTQHASTSTWPLSCIQYASPKSCGAGYAPTVQEGLKFAALLASKIIGRIGVHYGITGIGTTGSHASPWDQRKIYEQEVRSPLGQVPINAAEICRSHSNSSNQTH